MSTLCCGAGDTSGDTLRGDRCLLRLHQRRAHPVIFYKSRWKPTVNECRNVRLAAVVKPPGRFVLLWQIQKAEATTTPSQAVRKMPVALTQISLLCGALAEGKPKWHPIFPVSDNGLGFEEEGHRLPLQHEIRAVIAMYNAWKWGSPRNCVSLHTFHASDLFFLLPSASLSIAKG